MQHTWGQAAELPMSAPERIALQERRSSRLSSAEATKSEQRTGVLIDSQPTTAEAAMTPARIISIPLEKYSSVSSQSKRSGPASIKKG